MSRRTAGFPRVTRTSVRESQPRARVERRWVHGGSPGAQVSRSQQEPRPGRELTLGDDVAVSRQRATITDASVHSPDLTSSAGPDSWAQGQDLWRAILLPINETPRHATPGTRTLPENRWTGQRVRDAGARSSPDCADLRVSDVLVRRAPSLGHGGLHATRRGSHDPRRVDGSSPSSTGRRGVRPVSSSGGCARKKPQKVTALANCRAAAISNGTTRLASAKR